MSRPRLDPANFKEGFESEYHRLVGKNPTQGVWEIFCDMVYHDVRVRTIMETFVSKRTGSAMGKGPYYKWEARAQQVKGNV